MLIEICLIILGFLALYWALRPSADKLKYGEEIPGPVCYPIVGNLFSIPITGAKALMAQADMFKLYGLLVRRWMGNQLVINMADPADVETLLKSNTEIKKAVFYEFLASWLGQGLILSDGNKWRGRRKAISQTFHFKILDNFIDVFNRNGNILIECLSAKVDQGVFNALPYITAFTLDVICETAMGTQIGAQAGNNKDYQEAVMEASELFGKRFNTPILHNDLMWFLSGMRFKEYLVVKRMKQHTYEVIKSKARALKGKSEEINTEEESLGIKKKTAFLQLVLEMKNNLQSVFRTDEDVQEEVDNFMFAGHDTTKTAIGFTMSLLAMNPDCQDKLFEELSSKFSKDNCNPTMDDLNNLKYLDLVVKEAERLCPSVPTISREMTENLKLPSGYTIPKGAIAVINIFNMHRNEKIFPNPEIFNPYNFLPEVTAKRHPFAYIPFSAGPRNCIGQRFALLELKSTLIKLVRHFKLEYDPRYPLVFDSNLILQGRDGYFIKLSKRER